MCVGAWLDHEARQQSARQQYPTSRRADEPTSPQGFRRLAHLCGLWSVVCGLLVTGCAVLSRLRNFPAHPSPPQAAAQTVDDRYQDFVGVLHIHTRYSDGAGTYEEIARIANAQRLDYLIVTDHNTLKPLADGEEGWYGSTLVLVGVEISTRGGHYLAFNVTSEIDRTALTTQEIIDEVNRQGGLGFIAHPYFMKRRWTDWAVTGMTGIEAYNVAHDALDENRARLVLWTLTAPVEAFYQSIIDRPYDPLRTWDEMIRRHRRLVGIGASDAHEARVLGVKFAPYEIMFRLIRTHVLLASEALTAEDLYEALRSGHAYFSLELSLEAKGFSFAATAGGRVVGIMGDEVTLVPGLELSAWLPAVAQLVLFKDGQSVEDTIAQQWDLPITEAGTYRLEASRHNVPWIFSNPIYVRPPPEPPPPQDVQPTV